MGERYLRQVLVHLSKGLFGGLGGIIRQTRLLHEGVPTLKQSLTIEMVHDYLHAQRVLDIFSATALTRSLTISECPARSVLSRSGWNCMKSYACRQDIALKDR